MPPKTKTPISVTALTHDEATRKNIPTAEYQSVVDRDTKTPIQVAYERRNRDIDPQLVWRGKDEQDWSDLVVPAPPLYIQEKVHPKVLIDDLKQLTDSGRKPVDQVDLFADFNGLPDSDAKTEFYQHDAHWTNRMILGDSLQVMASLAEREGLRGKVQCIYFDPPYGIKFNSNFQWSTTSRSVSDGNQDHITREPEQVKAFRDTWRDGIHSYLTYLRDRLVVMRDILTDSGSIFIQISDENVHRVRVLLDEVFGDQNFISEISVQKTAGQGSGYLGRTNDYVLWYARNIAMTKYRQLYLEKQPGEAGAEEYKRVEVSTGGYRPATASEIEDYRTLPVGDRLFATYSLFSAGESPNAPKSYTYVSEVGPITIPCAKGYHFKFTTDGLNRVANARRMLPTGGQRILKRYLLDFAYSPIANLWTDTRGEVDMTYVVQTSSKIIQRCLLMATDPGDLVLDPTCGSGTTAFVAEQWGRRWITIDTSRVALALARARIMGARYPYYLLADSREGQQKEAEVTRSAPSSQPVRNTLRQGFVYERVPHITLKSIANNAEIDVIWEKFQAKLEPLREALNTALGKSWQEWEIPREAEEKWSPAAKKAHAEWWQNRVARQTEIDKSIAAKAESELLYDKPYMDKTKVRVAGPFTVESLSPHRTLTVGADDELIDTAAEAMAKEGRDFASVILENLKIAGVQQSKKDDKIEFSSLVPWPGVFVAAEGRYLEGNVERRAAVFIGPEFGTVSRPDLVDAAKEAGDAGFDVLITCAFNYDAHSTEFTKLGRLPVLKARMHADLHLAEELKSTTKGNLFVIFGEPDIDLLTTADGTYQVKVKGVDVFNPNTGKIQSDNAADIACWFLDSDYNGESFFVRHAYFLGQNDPYKSLKTTLKAEIDAEAWATLNSDLSRPFEKPKSGRIAVKVINHLGDEVMKVFRV
ncbi:MAG TPA: site-specific DNA-methyltransferase [Fibrobacteria bacterium]|nr:site-specific DNA-methyltransferase [Fibrobacteria bacterium]